MDKRERGRKMSWKPARNWRRITTCDVHAAGEPLRIITGRWPRPIEKSLLSKRLYLEEHYDFLRKAILWEPRGHANMYGCLLTEKERPDSDFGVLFLHNQGYGTMCGHGIIGLVTYVLETGLIEADGDHPVLKIDTAAGQVRARAFLKGGRVSRVSFQNVPSFVYMLDQEINIPGFGRILVDIAYGGAFYAFCRAEDLKASLTPENSTRLIDLGMRVKKAVMNRLPIRHPFEKKLGFLFGTIIIGSAHVRGHHSRNVCIFADGEVDRSPTGTGVSARAALHYVRGEIQRGEVFVVESILGTCFEGCVKEVTTYGPYPAVIPEITGRAFITGRNELLISPDDPLKDGFFLH